MQWDLGTRPITNIVTSFSADNKTWQEQPKQAGDYRFVRVVATEPAPVIFLRIFQPLRLGLFHRRRRERRAKTENQREADPMMKRRSEWAAP